MRSIPLNRPLADNLATAPLDPRVTIYLSNQQSVKHKCVCGGGGGGGGGGGVLTCPYPLKVQSNAVVLNLIGGTEPR